MSQTFTATACLLALLLGAGSANATVDLVPVDTRQQAETDASGETGPVETGRNVSPAPGFEIATVRTWPPRPPQSRPSERQQGEPDASGETRPEETGWNWPMSPVSDLEIATGTLPPRPPQSWPRPPDWPDGAPWPGEEIT